jgi:hypothetical protein
METINNFLIIWGYLVGFSFGLLPFRNDWITIQMDLKKLFFSSFTHFVISSVLAFMFMPIILIDTLVTIFRKDV